MFGTVLAAIGFICVGISLLEILASFLDSVDALLKNARRMMGLPERKVTDMEQAMAWVQVIGMLIFGGVLLAVGLSEMGV